MLGLRKVANLSAKGVTTIAVANPGCTLQIEAKARDLAFPLRTLHPIELLHMSLRNRTVSVGAN